MDGGGEVAYLSAMPLVPAMPPTMEVKLVRPRVVACAVAAPAQAARSGDER